MSLVPCIGADYYHVHVLTTFEISYSSCICIIHLIVVCVCFGLIYNLYISHILGANSMSPIETQTRSKDIL